MLSLSAVFWVQGKEPSVRQLALLHFRNTIVLSVKLEDALSRPRARVPPSVTQMLLILQVGLQASSQAHGFLICCSAPSLSLSPNTCCCAFLAQLVSNINDKV